MTHHLRPHTALAIAALLVVARPAAAEDVVDVPLGGVVEIKPDFAIARLSAGDPAVAEVSPLDNAAVLVKGLSVGVTSLLVWDRRGTTRSYRIRVGVDVDALSSTLTELFPGRKLAVQGGGPTVVVEGAVRSPGDVEAISAWLDEYKDALGPAGSRLQLVRRLTLPEPQQVRLQVRFAEVSRTKLRKLGLSVFGRYKGHSAGLFGAVAGLPELTRIEGGEAPLLPVPMPGVNQSASLLFMANPTAKMPFNALLSVLSARGVAKTLTEPTVVAQSGHQAQFLAGGEFPVPIPQGISQVSIEYKPFGVELDCKPFVLEDETIQLDVTAKVSELSGSVVLQGAEVPSLTSRRSKTTVRLRSGQSFALAGLLSEKVRNVVHKVPLLGDIPILGALFRTNTGDREETELVMVVTANLVGPVASDELPPLPGEGVLSDPTDLEFFLLGWPEDDDADPGFAAKPAGSVGYRD